MTTKLQFVEKMKRRLGNGAVKVHVTADQVEDAYLRALDFYYRIVEDATDTVFYKYQVTQADIDANKNQIALPSEIYDIKGLYVSRMGNGVDNSYIGYNGISTATTNGGLYGSSMGSGSSMYNFSTYYISVAYMNAYRNFLSPSDDFTYSRFSNKINLMLDLEKDVGVNNYLLFEATIKVNPDTYLEFHKDELLCDLASAYLEYQNAKNLTKLTGVSLPGGTKFDVKGMETRAKEDIKNYEKQVHDYYSPAIGVFML